MARLERERLPLPVLARQGQALSTVGTVWMLVGHGQDQAARDLGSLHLADALHELDPLCPAMPARGQAEDDLARTVAFQAG